MRKGVFLSYAPQDERWAALLKVHLNARQEELNIQIWDNSDIEAGANRAAVKTEGFQRMKIAIVLLSTSYFSSEVCQSDLDTLLEMQPDNEIIILPILAHPFMIPDAHPIAKLQPLNAESNSLAKMEEADFHHFFNYVGKRIKIILKDELEKEVTNLDSKGQDLTLKIELENDIQQLEAALVESDKEVRNSMRLALAKICVISILKRIDSKEYPDGMRIKSIIGLSKTKWRKYIFQSLDELEKWGYVEKNRMGKETYWKLSEKGLDFSYEIDYSFLFSHDAE
ncbi:MAG: TIR domain-containing protein [Bacteroidota bacterium]